MTAAATDKAKFQTFGIGHLTIRDVAFEDTNTDCTAFFMTTNTVLDFSNVEIYGSTADAGACNDGVILGGTGTTYTNTSASPFAGYHSSFKNMYFDRVKRAVVGNNYVNNVRFEDITVEIHSGNATGAAFEFVTSNNQSDTGNYFQNILVEVQHYKWGFWGGGSGFQKNVFIANSCYDPAAPHVACYQMDATAVSNIFIDGFSDDTYTILSEATPCSNTHITSHSGRATCFPGPFQVNRNASATYGVQVLDTTSGTPAFDIKNTSTLDEFYLTGLFGGTKGVTHNWMPLGGTVETMFTEKYAGANTYSFQNNATLTALLEAPSAATFALKATGGEMDFYDSAGWAMYLSSGKLHFKGGTTAASTGRVDFISTDSIAWRNAANTNDNTLGTVSDVLKYNGNMLNTGLPLATTASVGGGALTAGACTSGTATMTGVSSAMDLRATPQTYPGDGFVWQAYMSAASTVTVKVCAIVAGTPTASVYNVKASSN